MATPKDPGVDGVEGGMHDGMDQAGHDAQFGHANSDGKSDRAEQESEGGGGDDDNAKADEDEDE